MRQFDVLVWNSNPGEESITPTAEPPFTDPALGWLFGNNLNENLEKTDAEWIVLAHNSILLDRNFLNDLAQAIEGFPMVDSFAPRIKTGEGTAFESGFALEKKRGFQRIDDKGALRFVAVPYPALVAFSRRIIQRTGRLDLDFPLPIAIADYSLRMLHAGGRMFSVPYLVANTKPDCPKDTFRVLSLQNEVYAKPLAFTLYKNFGFLKNISFWIHHPSCIPALWKERKILDQKRDSAILLSKLKAELLKEISL